MRKIILLLLPICLLTTAQGFNKFEEVFLLEDSISMYTSPSEEAENAINCPQLFKHERMTILDSRDNWLHVMVAGGWTGWVKWEQNGESLVVGEDVFTEEYMTMKQGMERTEMRANLWSRDNIMIMIWSDSIMPCGFAPVWKAAFWSPSKKEYLVVTKGKHIDEEQTFNKFPTPQEGFDPYAYDRNGWATPLVDKVCDSPAVLGNIWNRIRSRAIEIRSMQLYRGPIPTFANCKLVEGHTSPRGTDMFYIRIEMTDGSHYYYLGDRDGFFKGCLQSEK